MGLISPDLAAAKKVHEELKSLREMILRPKEESIFERIKNDKK
jgi:hypothetical protein